ncbi:hypothetical protein [Pantoea piersonii]|uniref:hypothetical protein n=1 Tax=Pantoea piersonii TaxID=2364647 RepID=UPI0022F192FF|nr:hypothetical protein [Pantoea piersonii]WBV24232.1 hypothetical protein PG877_22895 [Pantoea piersonii]
MSVIHTINRNFKIIDDINEILKKHGIADCITIKDLTISQNSVNDLYKSDSKLSDLIVNHYWKPITSPTVYHYTSKQAAESIFNFGIFRLYNIGKRKNEGEIISFCKAHNLVGYLEPDLSGKKAYEDLLLTNTYYASFTDTDLTTEEEDYFWRVFAGGDGVRLKISIDAPDKNFRKMVYGVPEGKPLPLYDDIYSYLLNKHNLKFTLKNISTICSYYLSFDYSNEKESRLVYRYWGQNLKPIGLGYNSYVEIPLNPTYPSSIKINILEVNSIKKINMPSNYSFSKREI